MFEQHSSHAGRISARTWFTEFYNIRLCRRLGGRIASADLLAAYMEWAGANDRGSIGYRELSRFMGGFGHRLMKSSRMEYMDVAFGKAARSAPSRAALKRQLDQIIVGVQQLQLALGDVESEPPNS
ncbi:hypothetical protein Q4F19_06550 [Sphingomonas sp. BIUV-7]|uniref:EF-hand domain-containing protein n=1 Tax=Sphingomonas natans TaxID=3063330 RepID=A0ABT8Y6U4_9SPHN|nr:hypothetical protein [Sphingomonas sp. BIUV-7]MDO6414035.1 hypothetical protein [Sphingomonas sp. BIUV-7]